MLVINIVLYLCLKQNLLMLFGWICDEGGQHMTKKRCDTGENKMRK